MIAPFSGALIGIPDRADRVAFYRTVLQLTRRGELPPGTRIVVAGGDRLLTTLNRQQIAVVAATVALERREKEEATG